MLRHGYIRSPIQWRQVKQVQFFVKLLDIYANGLQDTFQGLWTAGDRAKDPDIVLYYVHGSYPVIYTY